MSPKKMATPDVGMDVLRRAWGQPQLGAGFKVCESAPRTLYCGQLAAAINAAIADAVNANLRAPSGEESVTETP